MAQSRKPLSDVADMVVTAMSFADIIITHALYITRVVLGMLFSPGVIQLKQCDAISLDRQVAYSAGI